VLIEAKKRKRELRQAAGKRRGKHV
jgi:hypothetical protein